MGLISNLTIFALSTLSKQCGVHKSWQHQMLLGTPRIKPGAAGQEARMPSTVLCGPPNKKSFRDCDELFFLTSLSCEKLSTFFCLTFFFQVDRRVGRRQLEQNKKTLSGDNYERKVSLKMSLHGNTRSL